MLFGRELTSKCRERPSGLDEGVCRAGPMSTWLCALVAGAEERTGIWHGPLRPVTVQNRWPPSAQYVSNDVRWINTCLDYQTPDRMDDPSRLSLWNSSNFLDINYLNNYPPTHRKPQLDRLILVRLQNARSTPVAIDDDVPRASNGFGSDES